MSVESRRSLTSLDPRSPLVVDTRVLDRRAGSMRKVFRVAPAPAGLGGDVAGVPEGSDIELDIRLEAVMEGVLVSGSARARIAGECVRCLDAVAGSVTADLQELYAYADTGVERWAAEHAKGETPRLRGDLLDLEPLVRDAVVLALPPQPVCRDDCPGLCPHCGARLDEDPSHHHEAADPRWAALQDLFTSTTDET